MKKIFTSLILLALFANLANYSFALSTSQKWQALKSFKTQEYEMLFENENLPIDWVSEIFETSWKAQLYWNIREKVKTTRENIEEQNFAILSKIENLEESLLAIEKDIENINNETIKINSSIVEVIKKINNTKDTISILRKKISDNKKVLTEYVVHIYKQGNYVYTDWEIDNLKAIIFTWEDISSIINNLYFKQIVEVTWKKLIDNHRKYVWQLYIDQLDLQNDESNLKTLRKQLIIKKNLLDEKKEFKEKILEVSKWKQWLFEKFIKEKIAIEEDLKKKEFSQKLKLISIKKETLEKQWCKYVNFDNITPENSWLDEKCKKLNAVIYAESKLKWLTPDAAWNVLKWPIMPKAGISAYFHDEWYIKLFWDDHYAIDLPAKQGTDIKAPADWYVIFSLKPTSLWYSYVALKHANWYVTVYWHLSDVLVKELDFIKEWEIFAKTGWEPWTKWAWLMTTGAHLHFEVWKDKKMQDPLKFLDLSVLNYLDLEKQYRAKFLTDFKAKEWVEFDEESIKKRSTVYFKIVWKSEVERQKNFLLTYWSGEFRNWSMWVEEWLNANVDPTFLMCLWLAETSLWKNMKTPNNVWNVWNNDRGDTVTFDSPREWVRAIAQTLNNKYLFKYDELSSLSRYWNQDWAIYASSSFNWHNNIVNCMTHIKWSYVSDDYNFRLK